MFIKQLQIKNFKCFKDETFKDLAVPNGEKGSGLNVLIGENNLGKTTFLTTFSKLKDNAVISDDERNKDDEDVRLIFLDNKNKERLVQSINKGANIEIKGESELSFSHIDFIKDNRIWTSKFSGFMAFDTYLLNSNTKREVIDSSLASSLSEIDKTGKREQFNKLMSAIIPDFHDWSIQYSDIANSSYISYQIIRGGRKINIESSLGSGILNLFRIVLSLANNKDIVIIDEPEAFLHPKAQEKLLELLLEEAKDKQIFISTHSPYMFKGAIGEGAKLLIFKRNDGDIEIIDARDSGWGIFGRFSPTWGEINCYAYDLPTVEFHNELYGFLQAQAINNDERYENEKEFDKYLAGKLNVKQCKEWKRFKNNKCKKPYNITLQTYIRNSIHHPENNCNPKYTPEELRNSIRKMIDFCKIIIIRLL